MARKGEKRLWAFAEASDPAGLVALMQAWLESLRVRGVSKATVSHYEWELSSFILWCGERGLTRPDEISRPVLERFQRYLFQYRTAKGHPLSFRSQYKRLAAPKYFFRWLAKHAPWTLREQWEFLRRPFPKPRRSTISRRYSDPSPRPGSRAPLGRRRRSDRLAPPSAP